jgi:uncharacterized protein (TIRG00374 family)
MMKNRGFLAKKILKTIVSISLLLWLLRYLDFNQIKVSLRSGNYLYFCLYVFFLILSAVFIRSVKLQILVKDLNLSFWSIIQLVLKAIFINHVLPTSIGGDAYKIHYLKKNTSSSWSEPFTLILIERLTGLTVLVTAGVIYFALNTSKLLGNELVRGISKNINFNFILMIVILTTLCLFLYLAIRYRSKLLNFLGKVKTVFCQISASTYLGLIFLSIIFHIVNLLAFSFLVKFFNENILFVDLIFVSFVTTVISLMPISLGALGVKEATMTLALSLFEVSKSSAVSVALVNRLFLFVLSFIGWVLYVSRKN